MSENSKEVFEPRPETVLAHTKNTTGRGSLVKGDANMVKECRKMREAFNAGNAYQLCGPKGFNYFPPAATTPEEVLAWAKRLFPASMQRRGRWTIEKLLPQSQIGCIFVEVVAEWDN